MRIAVTGATGRLGGQVAALLAADAAHEVVAVSRRPAGDLPPRARNELADYADLAALRTAFAGVDTLVFVSSDGPAVDVVEHHRHVVRAAVDAGVGHVVALSGLDADPSSPFCYGVTYGRTEQMLRAGGFASTVVRASIFTEFFVRWFVRDARTSGEVRLPSGGARVSLVSVADVGRALAAAALAPPAGRTYEVTGPAALRMTDVADPARPGDGRCRSVPSTSHPRPSSAISPPPTSTRGGATRSRRCSPRSASTVGNASPPM